MFFQLEKTYSSVHYRSPVSVLPIFFLILSSKFKKSNLFVRSLLQFIQTLPDQHMDTGVSWWYFQPIKNHNCIENQLPQYRMNCDENPMFQDEDWLKYR